MDMPLFIYDLFEEDNRRNSMRLERRIIRDAQNAFTLPNDQFVKLFRLNKELTQYLIEALSPYVPIPSRNTAVPFSLKVLATLNFYGHGSYQRGIGSSSWNCLSQPMISRSIKTVSRLITDHLMDKWMKFPINNISKTSVKEGFYNKWGMRGVIGVIDGCHVEIIAPPMTDEDHPPFVYINRKGKHSINVMAICDSNCNILAMDARYPGSVHDAAIFRSSVIRNFLREQYDNGDVTSHLLGDSGYGVEPWLFTPFLNYQPNSPEERFNILLKRNRNVIERTFGIMKKRFGCLSRHRVLLYHPSFAAYIIYAVAVCHNMALRANLDIDEYAEEIRNIEEVLPNPIQFQGVYADLGRFARNQYILENRV